MSKPDLAIIHSPEAEAFLRTVTKGFYNRSYIGLWIYEVIGREWDELRLWSEGMRTEIHPQTCTWSIAVWEWVYGFEPDESMALEERRRRILSKVIGAKPINPEVLRRGISVVSGAEAEVTDFIAPYRFGVTLNITNNPIPMERVLRYIYEAKPAHLSVAGVEVVFPITESALHIGGGAGAQTSVGLPPEPDVYDGFQNTIPMGGAFGAQTRIKSPARPDVYGFRDAIPTGGALSGLASFPVPEDTDPPPSTTILRTGGVCTILSNLSKGE